MVVCMNLMHGPFTGAARYDEFREASYELLDLLETGEQPFMKVYEKELCEEMCLTSELGQDGLHDALLSAFRDHPSMHRKNNRVAMCRFGAFVDALSDLVPAWCLYLLRCLHVLGDIKFGRKDMIQKIQESNMADRQGESKPSTSEGKLRDTCTSNVMLTAALLSDMTGRQRARVIQIASAPLRLWYGVQSQKLRSMDGCVAWLVEQLQGNLWQPMTDTMKLLSDVSALAACGIGIGQASKVSLKDTCVQEEHLYTECLSRYIMTLVAQRCKRLTWFTNGHLPDIVRIARCKHDEVCSGVQNIRDVHEAIAEARSKGKWWHDLAERTLRWKCFCVPSLLIFLKNNILGVLAPLLE
eukprot:6492718-Amphidinium_carterae.4